MNSKKHLRIFILVGLIFLNIFVWHAYGRELPSDGVTVAFLNIGQGDGIYIESPTHNQIMIDGGPAHVVLGELKKVMPVYDRSIDMLLVTNPDTDHYAGFIDILKNYDVGEVIEPGTKTDTQTYKVFEEDVALEHASTTLARRGMIIHLGGGADLHILFPDKDVSNLKTNDGSVIAKLVYKNNSVMFTGDAPNSTEEYTMNLNPEEINSDVLKAGHHGSRTSASEPFVKAVSPSVAVISAGVKNKYGHPHQETLDLFKKLHVPVLGTYDHGMIVMKLDGNSIQTNLEK